VHGVVTGFSSFSDFQRLQQSHGSVFASYLRCHSRTNKIIKISTDQAVARCIHLPDRIIIVIIIKLQLKRTEHNLFS
jgi:hypothetical protein